MIEREPGHYEVREVPYGKVYDWRPERVIFECECGETHVWSGDTIVCACGVIHGGVPGESEDRRLDERSLHPWLEDYEEWRSEAEAKDLHREYFVVEESDD